MSVTRIGDGVYRVAHDGKTAIVYVAGPADDRWAFWNGETFHVRHERSPVTRPGSSVMAPDSGPAGRADIAQSLAAPMPATVLKVLVQAGSRVRKGDTVLILEAMKMELPLRAPADALVTAVNCREGELVQPDVVLVELQ